MRIIIILCLLSSICLKSIIGYYFPWEKCPCCGKRLDKNHKPLSQRRSIEAIERDLDIEIEKEFRKWDIADKEWESIKKEK